MRRQLANKLKVAIALKGLRHTLEIKFNQRQVKFTRNHCGIFVLILRLEKNAANIGTGDIVTQLILAFNPLNLTAGIPDRQPGCQTEGLGKVAVGIMMTKIGFVLSYRKLPC